MEKLLADLKESISDLEDMIFICDCDLKNLCHKCKPIQKISLRLQKHIEEENENLD